MRVKLKRIRYPKSRVKSRAPTRAKNVVESGGTDTGSAGQLSKTNPLPAHKKQFAHKQLVGAIPGVSPVEGDDLSRARVKRKVNRHRDQFTTDRISPCGTYRGAPPGEAGQYIHYYIRQATGWQGLRGLDERRDTDREYEG